jgi:hypothetical protein
MNSGSIGTQPRTALKLRMKIRFAAIALCLLPAIARGQDKPQPESVTVPAIIDHNRVIIGAEIPVPDGPSQRVNILVDNGDADLEMSQRAAAWMGLSVSCDGQICSGHATSQVLALEIQIDGMKVFLPTTQEIKITTGAAIAPGLNAEINLPATVLRHYDVLIDFPGHKFTIGTPGSIHFQGSSAKAQINAANGLIQIPSQIENKKYNLALDLGSNISFLSDELFDKLQTAHPDWPHMTGAVGSANSGQDDEMYWKLMRLDRVQYGPLFLTNVAVVEFPKGQEDLFEKRFEIEKSEVQKTGAAKSGPSKSAIPTAGLLGSQALQSYRVGLDYAHAMVYFDIGRTFTFPDFDVVGTVLRPEGNGQFTILGIVDLDGKPSVPAGTDGIHPGDELVAVDDIPVQGSTMGQVWKMLGGTPEQERKLTIKRAGKQFAVTARVKHFLGETPDENAGKRRN